MEDDLLPWPGEDDGESMFDVIDEGPTCTRCGEEVEAKDMLCETCEEEFLNEDTE